MDFEKVWISKRISKIRLFFVIVHPKANRRTDEMDDAAHSMKLARLEEALQMKRAETMTAVMRAQTDLMKQSDEGVLNSVSPVPPVPRGDLHSGTGQADLKHLTNEFLNDLHPNIATANWVASNHTVGTKDPTSSTVRITGTEM